MAVKVHHWTPQEMHGVIPMPSDGDIRGAITRAMKKLLPGGFRRQVNQFDYMIHNNQDGSQSLIFEIQSEEE